MIGAWLCRVPVRIYHMHGLPMDTATGLKRRLLRWSETLSCRLAHQVYCVSPSLRTVAIAEGLTTPEKVHVLLHGSIGGVNAQHTFNPQEVGPQARMQTREEYGIPADALVIGFVGRVVRDKGVQELCEAWSALRAEIPSARLLVIGPMEEQDPIPAEVVRSLREDPRVHWTGTREPCDVPRCYAAMDVLALPTYREGFGNVLLEAAAMELPVVATRITGCVDAVADGVTATLVPPRDAAALATALRAYLSDEGLRRAHGSAGRVRALRDFDPQAMYQATCREYESLARVHGVTARMQDDGRFSPPRGFYQRFGKRLLDLTLSLLALAVLGPVLMVLAILVRVFLGTPILFRQRRTGFHRQHFVILKFRTMTNTCDANGNLLSDSQRLTGFGRFPAFHQFG